MRSTNIKIVRYSNNLGIGYWALNQLKKLFAYKLYPGYERIRNYLASVLPIDEAIKILILVAMWLIIICNWSGSASLSKEVEFLNANNLGRVCFALAKVLLLMNLALFLWRLYLVIVYRPCKTYDGGQLPLCTVVVPAYNESCQVFQTLLSIVNSDYPAEKLQIIAVDDGSVDDTWLWIQKAAAEAKGRIQTIRLSKNSGKRQALYAGFLSSRGQIIVTIDSDSIIEPATLSRMVSPFVWDRSIGAVAGNVRVLNRHEGLIPSMLNISFAYCFDFVRASQSMVRTVFCTPGALAAYRRDALMAVLKPWIGQKFWGRPANIGEDRALTNLILRSGYHVHFQSNAIVYTKVPVSYKGLCKMFLRWARSNIRETIVTASFIFSKFRQTSALGCRINFLANLINLVIPRFLFVAAIGYILWQPLLFLPQFLFGSIMAGLIPAAFYYVRWRGSDAVWAFAYAIFWCTALWWIIPYAALTVRNGNWLTRQISKPKGQPSQPRLICDLKTAS